MERCPHRTVAWACSLRDHEHVYPASASIAFSNMPTHAADSGAADSRAGGAVNAHLARPALRRPPPSPPPAPPPLPPQRAPPVAGTSPARWPPAGTPGGGCTVSRGRAPPRFAHDWATGTFSQHRLPSFKCPVRV
eukprot:1195142-Prorocentrum_minimum.AAC.1